MKSETSDAAVNSLFMVIYRLRGIEPLDGKQVQALRRAAPAADDDDGADEPDILIEGDELLSEILRLQSALDRWFSIGRMPGAEPVRRVSDLLRQAGRHELDQALLAVWHRHFPLQRIDAPERGRRAADEPRPNGRASEAAEARRALEEATGQELEPAGASDVTDYWSVPPVILMALGGVPPTSISLVQNRGDSMVPTLLDGDVAVIDTRHTIPSPDGLYALKDAFGSTVVKRLSIVSGADNRTPLVQVVSDNPKYEPRLMHLDELRIVGRILRKFGHVS